MNGRGHNEQPAPHAAPAGHAHRIASTHVIGLELYLRERRPPAGCAVRDVPLLLVHGATIASALWDAALPGWSWMDRLAQDGFHVFALDLRGYGGSGRPESFASPPEANTPYARAFEVVEDVADAVEFVRASTGAAQIDLLGGSWGSIVCGKFTAERAGDAIRKLVLYAPIYVDCTHRPVWLPHLPAGGGDTDLAHAIGAYRWVSVRDLRARWDAEIPCPDPSGWRPKGMLVQMLASYIEDRSQQDGGRFRVPNGTIFDLCCAFDGEPLYDCAQVTVPTLLIRGDADPISTAEGAETLRSSIGSLDCTLTCIPGGAHFMIAERAMPRVHAEIAAFLAC